MTLTKWNTAATAQVAAGRVDPTSSSSMEACDPLGLDNRSLRSTSGQPRPPPENCLLYLLVRSSNGQVKEPTSTGLFANP